MKVKSYPMRDHKTTIVFGFLMLLIVLFALITSSCRSQSGKLTQIPFEKVVIVDSYQSQKVEVNSAQVMYKYKVNRISKGVVTAIYDYNLYEKGDTIFHRFINE
jgi:hypothetical protein